VTPALIAVAALALAAPLVLTRHLWWPAAVAPSPSDAAPAAVAAPAPGQTEQKTEQAVPRPVVVSESPSIPASVAQPTAATPPSAASEASAAPSVRAAAKPPAKRAVPRKQPARSTSGALAPGGRVNAEFGF
jgi:hypothetical protein